MDDAVRQEHVRLHDARGHVARGDVVARRVQHERERLARGGRRARVGAGEERRVDGRAVDELRAGGAVGNVSICARKLRGAKERRTWFWKSAMSALWLDARLARLAAALSIALLFGAKSVNPRRPVLRTSKRDSVLVAFVLAL